MTIRDLVILFGYKVDPAAEKKVNESIGSLKTFASKALGETEVAYAVNQDSEKKVEDSIDALQQHADNELSELSVGYEVDRASEQQAMDSIRQLRAFATKFLGAIGIGFSLIRMASLSEEFGNVNDMVRDATRGMGDQLEIQQRIKRAANEARQEYGVMADTISRLVDARAFGNVEDAANFATLMSKEFAAQGKSQQESADIMRQITTSLQQGRVDARAMMIMFRESPRTVQMLADSLGVTSYALQDMAKSGEISAEVLKSAFLDNADDIAARFGELDLSISDALRHVRNGWGLFLSQMDSTIGVSRMVSQAIVRTFNQVLFMLRRGSDAFMRFADRVGGVNNLMRLLAIAAGAIFLALNGAKILTFLNGVWRALLKINIKVIAIVAILAILALIIDDFIAFMRGDSSLLGEMLEKFGVDADKVREVIGELWETIRGVLPFLMELAKQFGGLLVRALQTLLPLLMSLWRQILPSMVDFIRRLIVLLGDFGRAIIPLIVSAIEMLLPIILDIINAVLPVLIDLINKLLPVIITIIESVLPVVIGLLEKLLPIILKVVEAVLPVMLAILNAIIPVIEFMAELLGTVLGTAFEGLIPIIYSFMKILGGLIDFIAGVFTGDWERAWQGVQNIFSGIIGALGGILRVSLNSIIAGINLFIRGLNRVQIPDWVPGVGGMGMNIPEIPMLAKGSNFSPDTFIAGEEGPELITNARGSKVFTAGETIGIFEKLRGLDGIYQTLYRIAKLGVPDSDGATSALTSYIENKYINMNVDIYNEFNGDRAGQEKSAEAIDNATEDISGVLARALEYVG